MLGNFKCIELTASSPGSNSDARVPTQAVDGAANQTRLFN